MKYEVYDNDTIYAQFKYLDHANIFVLYLRREWSSNDFYVRTIKEKTL